MRRTAGLALGLFFLPLLTALTVLERVCLAAAIALQLAAEAVISMVAAAEGTR